MDVNTIKVDGTTDRASEFPVDFNLWANMWISNFCDSSITNEKTGMSWYNNDTNKFRYLDKYGSWKNVLNEDDKATILGTVSSDYYTKTDSDTRYVNSTGDTMTGDLVISKDSGVDSKISLLEANNVYGAVLRYDADNNLVKLQGYSSNAEYEGISFPRVPTIGGLTYMGDALALEKDHYTKSEIDTNIGAEISSLSSSKANINSPSFTGTPTAPTQASSDSSTRLATTAFVKNSSTKMQHAKFGTIKFTRASYSVPKDQTFTITFPEAFSSIEDISFSFVETSNTNHSFLIVGTAKNITNTGCTVYVQTSMDTSQTAVCDMYYRAYGK